MKKNNKCPICGELLFVIDGKNRCLNFPIRCTYQESLDNSNTNNYIVFDFETTGVNRSVDRIIQVAAVRVKDGVIVDEYDRLVHPGKLVSSNISQLTGITNEMLQNEADETVVIPEFINWVNKEKPQYFVAHNGNFDVDFLKSACRRIGGLVMPVSALLDTLKFARKVFPKGNAGGLQNHKQETLAKHYGIKYDAHNAKEDVKALQQIYVKLCEDGHKKNMDEMNYIEFI